MHLLHLTQSSRNNFKDQKYWMRFVVFQKSNGIQNRLNMSIWHLAWLLMLEKIVGEHITDHLQKTEEKIILSLYAHLTEKSCVRGLVPDIHDLPIYVLKDIDDSAP